MKNFKKITALLALALVICMLFTGCEGGAKIKKFLALDVDFEDPALVMVADLADKTVKSEDNKTTDGYKYTAYTDDTASITGYEGDETVLNIPGAVDGLKVIGLDNKAFFKNETITELNFPDSLKYIGNYAVMHSRKLEKVTFGKEIEYIGVSAFECAKDKPTTSNGSLKTIVWNGAPKTISAKAFYFCDKVSEIVLPEGVETIGDWAFAKNFSADKIILPDSLKTIANHAFLKCSGAKEIVIGGNVKNIEMSAFYRCSAAEKLTLKEGIEVISKGAFEECHNLTEVTIPSTVRTLGNYAFYNCEKLTDITIGKNTVNFSDDCFSGDGKVTIHAEKGSAAAEFAQSHDITLK